VCGSRMCPWPKCVDLPSWPLHDGVQTSTLERAKPLAGRELGPPSLSAAAVSSAFLGPILIRCESDATETPPRRHRDAAGNATGRSLRRRLLEGRLALREASRKFASFANNSFRRVSLDANDTACVRVFIFYQELPSSTRDKRCGDGDTLLAMLQRAAIPRLCIMYYDSNGIPTALASSEQNITYRSCQS